MFFITKELCIKANEMGVATGRAAERGQGQIAPGPQGPKGLIIPNASKSRGLIK